MDGRGGDVEKGVLVNFRKILSVGVTFPGLQLVLKVALSGTGRPRLCSHPFTESRARPRYAAPGRLR